MSANNIKISPREVQVLIDEICERNLHKIHSINIHGVGSKRIFLLSWGQGSLIDVLLVRSQSPVQCIHNPLHCGVISFN